ncbi:MAG: hypothetical protein QOD61_1600 [Solirubrobacteraceae bacterium]|nr:hypothetical protein [Solirubrobacteraceae bacterium]
MTETDPLGGPEATGGRGPGVTRRSLLARAAGVGLVAVGADQLIAACGGSKPAGPVVSVRGMGARGDGVTNDTRAFQLASAAIVAAGGGTLEIPPGVYVIGRQVAAGPGETGFAYRGEPVIEIKGCRGQVVIQGRGAILRCAPGLRLGAFDPRTGRAHVARALPFLDPSRRADIYYGAIHLEGNRSVRVTGVEVDGNIDAIELGGQYGDGGYQVSHDGLVGIANGELVVEGAYFHHHGRDGVMISDPSLTAGGPSRPVTLNDVRSDYNGRQGLSWVGGRGLRATGCSFSYTGQTRISVSNPGAGVDIEPEVSVCRDGSFTDCRFVANRNFGVIANVGDSRDISFERCVFWGWRGSPGAPTPVALWANKPGMSFRGCELYGSVVQVYGSARASDACRFESCRFEDRPHPTFGIPYAGQALIETGGENVSFDGCTVVANSHRSLALVAPVAGAGRMTVSGCRIVHRDASLPAGSYQASLSAVRLSDTSFEEAGLSEPYFIATQGLELGSGVSVSGPHVAWERPGGPIGRIS